MIYIDKNSVKMTILKSENAQISRLELVNQTDKNKMSFELTEEDVLYKKSSVEIDISGIISNISVAGQYDYYLYSGDRVVESGILQYENFDNTVESYNIETNLIQYNK